MPATAAVASSQPARVLVHAIHRVAPTGARQRSDRGSPDLAEGLRVLAHEEPDAAASVPGLPQADERALSAA
jgi:hypothetical protein